MATLIESLAFRLIAGGIALAIALATVAYAVRVLSAEGPGLVGGPIADERRERELERAGRRPSAQASDDGAQDAIADALGGADARPRSHGGDDPGLLERGIGLVASGLRLGAGLLTAVAAWLASLLWPAVLFLSLPFAPILATRAHAARRRRYRRFEIVPHDHKGDPSPLEVARFFDQLHQRRIARWYERLAFGQEAVTLELLGLVRETPAGTRREIKFGLACLDDEAVFRSVRAAVKQAVSGASIEPVEGAPPFTGQVIRLKKARHFLPRSLDIPVIEAERGGYEMPLSKSLSNSLKRATHSVLVQYVLVPAPRWYEGWARLRYRQTEDRMERERERGTRGTSSELADEALDPGAKGVAWRHLFFCEARVSSEDYESAQSLASDIQAHVKGANELRHRHIRVRRGLYAKRIARCLPNPVPSWSRGTYSTAELAGLWQPPEFGQVRVPMRRARVNLTISAPPEIWRAPEKLALARDKQGPVGIRLEDLQANHMALGSHGSGKTSLMLRQAALIAQLPDHALIAIDPKPEFADRLLACLPPWREAAVIDFDRPECGFNPFEIPGASADDIADSLIAGLIEVSRTEEGDSQVYQSSRRFYKMAIVGSLAAYAHHTTIRDRPSFWDVWKLLQPTEDGGAERARISDVLASDPEFFGAQMGLEALTEQLRAARSAFVQRLDAPTNKLELLTSASADRVLRHPHSVSIDEVIRRRGVLIVRGAAKNADLTRTLNLFLLAHLHRALLRQLDLPEAERARVFLLGDEAHQLFSPTLEQTLSMARAAGFATMLAWQTMGQIPSRQMAAKILPLLKHRSIFNVGPDDARELSAYVQTETIDQYRPGGDPGRIAPHDLSALSLYTFAAAWVSRGAPIQSFYGETYPMADDPERRRDALELQRRRGGHPLERRPPLPIRVSGAGEGAVSGPEQDGPIRIDLKAPPAPPLPDEEVLVRGEDDGGKGGVRRSAAAAAVASPKKADARGPGPAEQGDPAGAEEPGTLVGGRLPKALDELVALERPSDLRWEEPPDVPADFEPAPEDLEALAALWRVRFMTGPQIRRSFFRRSAESTVRNRLARWQRAGLVHRGALSVRGTGGGRGKPVFTITERGFRLCQAHRNRAGTYIDSGARFREPQIHEGKLLLHDLHNGAWVIRLTELAGNCLEGWYGQAQSYLEIPLVRDPAGMRPARRDDLLSVWKAENLRVFNFPAGELANLKPDAKLELVLDGPKGAQALDFLVEYERAARTTVNVERLRAYEAMMAAWHRLLPRYQSLGRAPRLVYVAPDAEVALALAKLADRTLDVAVGGYEGPETWEYPARRLTYFACEADVHQGLTRAFVVHPKPPGHRAKTAPRRERSARAKAGWGIGVREFIAARHLLR